MIKIGNFYRFVLFAFLIVICSVNLNFVSPKTFGIPVDLVFQTLVLIILLPVIIKGIKIEKSSKVYIIFTIIIIWSFVTTFNQDYLFSYKYITFSLLMAWVTMTLGFLFSKVVYFRPKKTMWIMFVLLTLFFGYYAYSALSQEGLTRLAGALGGAAVIHVSILLVLSYFFHKFFHNKKHTIINLIFVFLNLSFVVLTGSRAGLLSVILFVLLFLMLRINNKKMLGVVLFLSVVSVFIVTNFPMDRYSSLEITGRTMNLNVVTDYATQSPQALLLGNGYGTIFQWFAYGYGGLPTLKGNLVQTLFGSALYHAHSTFLEILGEMGLISLILFLGIFIIVIKDFWITIKDKSLKNTMLLAVICTMPSFALDLYLLANWDVSFVWWLFVFSALSIKSEEKLSKEF